MKKLFYLGDMHFSTRRDWDKESFENFINWFENYDFGKYEDCEFFQLGDVTEKSLNSGDAYSLLTDFTVKALKKFKKIYIIGGNHCSKYDTEKNIESYSSEYLAKLSDNIKLIYKEQEIEALDSKLKILALPFRHTSKQIETYYNEDLPEHFYKNHYNIICGHEMIYDENFKVAGGVNLKKFNYDHAVFGHIHQRFGNNASMYTGSIMPFRKSEEKTVLPRCMKVFNEDGVELKEIVLPIFRQYHVIDFKKEKPTFKKYSDKIVHVYEFINCGNDFIASNMYSDYYVKKTSPLKIDDNILSDENIDKNILIEDDFTVLEQMCKEQNIILKRGTKALLKELLPKKVIT